MKLKEISVDVLAAIFDGAFSFLVVELWKCGDVTLNSKLANRGVKDVVLSKSIPDRRSRWPRMLKHLKLRSLAVSSDHALGTTAMIRKELLSLPPSIQTLRLIFQGAPTALFPSGKTDSLEVASDARSEPSLDAHDALRGDGAGDQCPFAELFPNLEEFDLGANSPFSNIEFLSLTELPSSLHTLNLSGVVADDLSGLPSSLKHFAYRDGHELRPSTLKTLPSSLTKLEGEMNREAWQYLNSPAGEAHFPDLDFSNLCLLQPESLDVLVPPSSTKWLKKTDRLEFYRCDSRLFALEPFPAGITSLSFVSCTFAAPLDVSSHLLPPTLETLNVASLDWSRIEERPSSLPKSLKGLCLNDDNLFGPQHFYLLPRELKSLLMAGPPAFPPRDEDTGRGPLEDESSVLALVIAQLQQEDQHRLDKILQDSKSTSGALSKRFSARNLSEIQNGRHFGLPLHLTELSFAKALSHWAKFILPPFVTRAHVRDLGCMDTALLLECLPPVTTWLSITGPSKLYHPTVDQWTAIEAYGARFFSNLVSVTFMQGDQPFPLDLLQHLPKTLKSLSIEDSEPVDPKVLQQMPPNLTSLKACFIIAAPAEWAHFLPRALTLAEFSGAQLAGGDIQHLPRTLESLILDYVYDLNSQHVAALPPPLKFVWSQIIHIEEENDYSINPYAEWGQLLVLRNHITADRPLSDAELGEYDELITAEEEEMALLDVHPDVAREHASQN